MQRMTISVRNEKIKFFVCVRKSNRIRFFIIRSRWNSFTVRSIYAHSLCQSLTMSDGICCLPHDAEKSVNRSCCFGSENQRPVCGMQMVKLAIITGKQML